MTIRPHPVTRPAPGASGSADRPAVRVRRGVVEFAPPFVVALVLLPWIISNGSFWPWRPSTIDLEVYVYAVNDMLAGNDIFATTTPGWNLYFIYPPIAAILMTPLAFGPYAMWQLIWTAGLIGAQQSVLRRCGVPRGWKVGLIGVALVLAVEPIRTTLGYGQVNTMLLALVIADLLPDAEGERRVIPRGALIGLAAAVKLTPALFVVFAFAIGRRRIAWTAIASFALFTLLGAALLPRETLAFATGLTGGQTRTASPLYVGNQSLLGVFYRLDEPSRFTTLVGLGFSGIVALLSVIVAAHWWKRNQRVFAVALVGLGTCLASPLSWTHHYVWIVPLAVVVLRTSLPRWVRGVSAFWVVWVSICLPLVALPYRNGIEKTYGPLQEFVGNIGPLTGVLLLVGLAVQQILILRARAARTRTPQLAQAAG